MIHYTYLIPAPNHLHVDYHKFQDCHRWDQGRKISTETAHSMVEYARQSSTCAVLQGFHLNPNDEFQWVRRCPKEPSYNGSSSISYDISTYRIVPIQESTFQWQSGINIPENGSFEKATCEGTTIYSYMHMPDAVVWPGNNIKAQLYTSLQAALLYLRINSSCLLRNILPGLKRGQFWDQSQFLHPRKAHR